MAYAEQKYSVSGYLLGRSPAVPEAVFPYWEKQAERIIDQYTFDRVKRDNGLVSDMVRDCACELAELLYAADSVSQQTLQQGGAGPLVSYSNDGESGTFDLSQSVYTESGKAAKIREIIYRYLGSTGLLYAGV